MFKEGLLTGIGVVDHPAYGLRLSCGQRNFSEIDAPGVSDGLDVWVVFDLPLYAKVEYRQQGLNGRLLTTT